MGFALLSQAFRNNCLIPRCYTCDGWNLSPPLMWMHWPEKIQSLALIVEDPDAPEKPWTHWLLYNIPPGIRSLSEGIPPAALPDGCRQGKNDWGRTGYGGPCPPNDMHRYVHHLHALECASPPCSRMCITSMLSIACCPTWARRARPCWTMP